MRGWFNKVILAALFWAAVLSSTAQDVTGNGLSRYHGVVPITSELSYGLYRLKQSARNIHVHDMRFDNISFDVLSPSADWSQRYTLGFLNITSLGTAWQDLEDPAGGNGPELELRLCNSSGAVIRSMPIAYPISTTYSTLHRNLVIHPGVVRLLIVDKDLLQDDTLAYMQLSLSANTEPLVAWPGGMEGSITKTQGDAAVDVYWGTTQAYDFFQSNFGWVPSYSLQFNCVLGAAQVDIDINTTAIGAYEAEANPICNDIEFGMGGAQAGPYASLDILAHEYTHLVIGMLQLGAENAPLEARALNEAFADMMAAAIERHVHLTSGVNFISPPEYWTIGEHVRPGGLRSMSAPVAQVYGSTAFLFETLDSDIYGMAGVPDRWFHLLVEGGSGVVNGTPFNVPGIGWDTATAIAYRTMQDKLFTTSNPFPNFHQAALASIEAASELYPGTAAAAAVQEAWRAVGVLTNPSTGCTGEATFVGSTGTFTDGSGSANYANSLDCDWLIKPTGMDVINVYFTQFAVTAGDTVYIHSGDNSAGPVLAKYSGSTVPPQATFNTPSVTVRFLTNTTGNSSGWTLNYTASTTGYCSSATAPFTAPTGSFSDGSGSAPYASNTNCGWYIAPPGATSVTLTFSAFDTENGVDLVKVYDGLNTTVPPIATFSGNTIPSSVSAPSGSMFVVFESNSTVQAAGWIANYTSAGSAFCGGTTSLTALSGSFSDGSDGSNYQNNAACGWLIQPAGASAVQLSFTAFDVEPEGSYGQVYDAVRVYDGTNASATLLGTFMGNELPGTLLSSGPALYVLFTTDNATTAAGWSASYTGLTGSTCSGTQVFTALSGSFEDGSGPGEYTSNSQCNWLIEPENAVAVTLTFTAFATQLNADGVIVYDGPSTASPVMGIYTGSTLPPVLTSSTGSMLVRFVSDANVVAAGFQAQYVATIVPPGPPAIVAYEYWFDDADGEAEFRPVPPTTLLALNQELTTDGIEPGGHVLHIRFKYINGLWSSVLSRPFLKGAGTPNGEPYLSTMEYWFDENPEAALTIPLNGDQLDLNTELQTNGLSMGGHTVHMRFLGNAGWSSVLSRPFFQGPSTAEEALVDGYEYWFDEDPSNPVSASIAPVPQLNLSEVLPTDGLPTGLHVLHIRFHGAGGWSSVLSRPFFRAGSSASLPNLIAGYRYWFNEGDANAVDVSLSTPQTPFELAVNIDASLLTTGAHVFHIQFQDIGGNWGSVLSESFSRTPTPTVAVPLRVFLDGPYNPLSQLMLDSLRNDGLLPLSEPYTEAGFLHAGEGGGETFAASVLNTSGPNAIVDWVLIEARDINDNSIILNTRSALLQRDGDVVDMDGISTLGMAIPTGDYHIAVRHRNHLGAMTLGPVTLSGATSMIDFTTPLLSTYGTAAQKDVDGKRALWSGNAVIDGNIKYTGQQNDRDAILLRIGGTVPTNAVLGYFPEDITLDGVVKYTGANNDRDKILLSIGGVIPTTIRLEQLP